MRSFGFESLQSLYQIQSRYCVSNNFVLAPLQDTEIGGCKTGSVGMRELEGLIFYHILAVCWISFQEIPCSEVFINVREFTPHQRDVNTVFFHSSPTSTD
jgi:hypothetical protein